MISVVKNFKKEGVNILDTIQEFEYGKFVHILDPEGNKIELWEAKLSYSCNQASNKINLNNIIKPETDPNNKLIGIRNIIVNK